MKLLSAGGLTRPSLRANALRGSLLLLVIVAALALVACTGKAGTPATASTVAATGTAAAAGSGATTQSGTSAQSTDASGGLANAVTHVTQQVKPAVVQITNEQVQPGALSSGSVPAGVGSGVIYDDQGHVLTNFHVVEGAQKLLVTLTDGRSFPGTLVGGDRLTDLAVVQIKGDNLPTAKLGDSGKLQVGNWVVAIGNALALPGGPTVTAGVVSALGRTVQEPPSQTGPAATSGPYLFDVIQTDTAINPGNSGGPLVNLNGEVIGINTLVQTSTGAGVPVQGIGYAIAINTAKPIADELVANGKVDHALLGVQYLPLNPGIAAQLGIQQTQGALIRQVSQGGPAEQAGLQSGDVITKVDNTEIKGESDLAQVIEQHKPGDTVTVTYDRNGQSSTAKVTLGTAPQQ